MDQAGVVASDELVEVADRGTVNLLHFHNGMVLMISATAVVLYRDRKHIGDPLGNGVIGFEAIPEPLRPSFSDAAGYVSQYVSGFVGLTSGAALFIRPDGIALYPDNQAALHNRAMQWLIPFGGMNG